jgi:hypothetical protein
MLFSGSGRDGREEETLLTKWSSKTFSKDHLYKTLSKRSLPLFRLFH